MFGLGNIGIGMGVYLRDHFSANALRVTRAMVGMNATANQVRSTFSNNYQGLKAMGGAMVTAGVAMTLGIAAAVKVGMEYEKIMDSVGAVTQATKGQMESMKDTVKALAKETKYHSSDIGKAMEDLAKAGFNPEQINATIGGITSLAAATDTHLSGEMGASEIFNSIMQGYGIATSRSSEIADVLTYAVNKSAIGMSDMFEAIKYGASDARSLGLELEDHLSIIMALGNVGLKGSIAGTSSGNMLRYLSTAVGQMKAGETKKAAVAMGQIGLSIEDIIDSEGNLKDIVGIINKFQIALGGMGEVDKLNALRAIFGERGKRGIEPLLRDIQPGQIGQSLGEFRSALENTPTGYANSIAAEKLDNLAGDFGLFVSNLQVLATTFYENIQPGLRRITQFGTWLIQGLDRFFNSGLGSLISKTIIPLTLLVTLVGGLALAVGTFGKFFTTFGVSFRSMIQTIRITLSQLMAQLMGVMGANRIGGTGTIAMNRAGRPYSRGGTVIMNGRTYASNRYLPVAQATAVHRGMTAAATAGGVLTRTMGLVSRGFTSLLGIFNPWIIGLMLGLSLLTDFNGTMDAISKAIQSLADYIMKFLEIINPGNWFNNSGNDSAMQKFLGGSRSKYMANQDQGYSYGNQSRQSYGNQTVNLTNVLMLDDTAVLIEQKMANAKTRAEKEEMYFQTSM